MEVKKIVTIFGIDTLLGDAVARAVASRKDIAVRGVPLGAKDADQIIARAKEADIEVVAAVDTGSVKDLVGSLSDGVKACFVSTPTDFTDDDCMNKEVSIGKRIIDACEIAEVTQIVLHTQLNVLETLGVRVRHMDAKAEIEAYAKGKYLPTISIIVPCLYQHFYLSPLLRPKPAGDESYSIEIPIGPNCIDLIDVEDAGKAIAGIMDEGGFLIHKTFSLSADKLTVREIAALFSDALSPKQFTEKRITKENFRDQGIPGAADLALMFDFFVRVDQRASIDTTKRFNYNLKTMEEWLKDHAADVLRAFEQGEHVDGNPLP